ncbi:hypothetical protein ABVG11_37750 [Streptomyces sp. HD1123-B1]|nr:hypothetical protein [Streptomyces botrytidirepellens]
MRPTGVFVTEHGLLLRELAEDVSEEEVRAKTEAPLVPAFS